MLGSMNVCLGLTALFCYCCGQITCRRSLAARGGPTAFSGGMRFCSLISLGQILVKIVSLTGGIGGILAQVNGKIWTTVRAVEKMAREQKKMSPSISIEGLLLLIYGVAQDNRMPSRRWSSLTCIINFSKVSVSCLLKSFSLDFFLLR